MTADQVRTACVGIVLLCICGLILLAPADLFDRPPHFISQSN